MWGVSMDNEQKERRLAELGRISDGIKELKLKRLELEAEQDPILHEYKETRFRHLLSIENMEDLRSNALFANDERKQDELEHRLRLDPKAKELSLRLRQKSREIEQVDIEIENLKDKKLVCLTSLGLPFPQDIMDILSDGMEEADYTDEDGDEGDEETD